MTTVLYDVTRLMIRASLPSATGIDRVAEAYARWLLSRTDIDLRPVCSWGGYFWTLSRKRWEDGFRRERAPLAPSSRTWERLVDALANPAPDAAALRPPAQTGIRPNSPRQTLSLALRTAIEWRPAPLPREAIYLNVSHFGLEHARLFDRLRAYRLQPAVMIHDLIPIAHPEFCNPAAERLHRRRIDSVLAHSALVIANSATTAAELSAFAAARGCAAPRVCVAPLGLEPAFLESQPALRVDTPYFVCVGTLEPRKNLTFLLTVWRRLAEGLGEATPHLVLAGQRGWENESIIDQLERSPPIRRFVHEASGLDDAQIARLVAGARALLSPSFTEGFNLPVREALALGTAVIASDIPAHRELAPGARLIDPLDGPAWLDAIARAAQTRPAAPPPAPLTWSGHFEIVAQALGLDGAATATGPRGR